jgi:ribosome-binding protein aMBF1 (putative translation factor)
VIDTPDPAEEAMPTSGASPADVLDVAAETDVYRLRTDVIAFALRCRDWSNAEFARQIDVHESTVSRIMGGAPTTAKVARRIRSVFPRLDLAEIVDLGALGPDLPVGINTAAEV